MLTRLVCFAALLAGCDLYWDHHGGGDDTCVQNGAPPQFSQLRDPQTGQCETFGGQNCGGCQPCEGAAAFLPDWATCNGACEQLTNEAQCVATPGCHTTYFDQQFWACWEVEPSGPKPGACDSLDAYDCTSRDDCLGRYANTTVPNGLPEFSSCGSEPLPPPPPPPVACETLTTEMDCKARTDCEPIYNGQGCICDPHGCTCQTETFAYCQSRQ
jgi:hypothetical protein